MASVLDLSMEELDSLETPMSDMTAGVIIGGAITGGFFAGLIIGVIVVT